MKFFRVKNYDEMSDRAFEIVVKQIKKKPNSVLVLASGKTPKDLYRRLSDSHKNRKLDFSKVRIFNLDEFYPIKKSDKRSFYYYFQKNLVEKVNLRKENVCLFNGEANNSEKECRDYERKIKKIGIDLAVVGVGKNGHIAFNEPGSSINSKARVVELKHKSVKKKAMTLGVSNILSSKKILFLASGSSKKKAVSKLLNNRVDKGWPVSFLKKHKNLIVVLDEKAVQG